MAAYRGHPMILNAAGAVFLASQIGTPRMWRTMFGSTKVLLDFTNVLSQYFLIILSL